MSNIPYEYYLNRHYTVNQNQKIVGERKLKVMFLLHDMYIYILWRAF